MKRREIIKGITLLPLSGAALATVVPNGSAVARDASPFAKRDLVKELGIRTFINAAGTYTIMTASLMHEDVLAAINNSAKVFCMLNEVHDKVGEKIAKIVHSEAAMVTAGAFSALTLGMAGILTGTDEKKIAQLPFRLEENGMKSEVIIQKAHYDGYEKALLNTGITLVPVETAEDVEKAVNAKTASMHFLNCNALEGKIMHEEWVRLATKHNLPATIDIAADVPPVENLWRFNDMGFSFVALSGGKAVRGPQSAGILMGKANIIAGARLNNAPNSITIGRGMKVNKEEILGMYAALEMYVNQDHEKEWKMWEGRVDLIKNVVTKFDSVTVSVSVPPIANHSPRMKIAWDQKENKINKSSPW
ncbi:MAG: selenocysteine synthase [Chitinophagaceae bacterium]